MTDEQINNCLALLDRAPITGHKEREAMNEVVAALVAMCGQQSADEPPPEA